MHQVCTCIPSLFELLPLQILCANNNIIINISLSVLDFKGNNKKTSFLNWLLGQDLYLLFPRISLFPLVQSQRIFQCFTCSTVFSQTNKTDILTNNIIHSESLHQKKYQHHPYVQSLYIFTGKKNITNQGQRINRNLCKGNKKLLAFVGFLTYSQATGLRSAPHLFQGSYTLGFLRWVSQEQELCFEGCCLFDRQDVNIVNFVWLSSSWNI